jgi:hypothetical protein
VKVRGHGLTPQPAAFWPCWRDVSTDISFFCVALDLLCAVGVYHWYIPGRREAAADGSNRVVWMQLAELDKARVPLYRRMIASTLAQCSRAPSRRWNELHFTGPIHIGRMVTMHSIHSSAGNHRLPIGQKHACGHVTTDAR